MSDKLASILDSMFLVISCISRYCYYGYLLSVPSDLEDDQFRLLPELIETEEDAIGHDRVVSMKMICL